MISRCWVHEYEDNLFTIAIRQPESEFPITASVNKFPPTELVNGKRISIIEAEELGLVEDHTAIRFFSREDLLKLRAAIDEVL